MLVFACFCPHAPILLPDVGSEDDHKRVDSTIKAMGKLGEEFVKARPEIVIVSSPHQDWGIKVPMELLSEKLKFPKQSSMKIFGVNKIKSFQSADSFNFNNEESVVYPILTTFDTVRKHYEWGKEIGEKLPKDKRIAWVASGDMAHTLKADGPYGYNPKGPEFDKKFIEFLKKKDIEGILSFDNNYLEEAGVCGIWSFAMCLGALASQGIDWKPRVLSYEGPFGVGYLVANLKFEI